jgi:MacB-like periplasmic core domain
MRWADEFAQDPGPTIRATVAPSRSRVHAGGGGDVGAGHRREHGPLQRDLGRAPAAAALSRGRPAGSSLEHGTDTSAPPIRLGAAGPPRVAQPEPHVRGRRCLHPRNLHRHGHRPGRAAPGGPHDGELVDVAGGAASPGRLFSQAEEEWGAHRVVVLSERVWRRLFGANPAMIGSPLQLDGESFTVIGVLSESFQFPNDRMDGRGEEFPVRARTHASHSRTIRRSGPTQVPRIHRISLAGDIFA